MAASNYVETPSYFLFPLERGSKCNGCKILNPPLFPFPFVKGGLKYYGNNLLNSPPISNWRGNSKYYIYGDNILNPPPIFPSHCMGRWFKIFHGHKILNHLSNWNGKQEEVQFTVIIFWIPFTMGNGKTELGKKFCGHNILNPCSISYRGVQYFSAKYWTWVQNIAEYFRPAEFNIAVSNIMWHQVCKKCMKNCMSSCWYLLL